MTIKPVFKKTPLKPRQVNVYCGKMQALFMGFFALSLALFVSFTIFLFLPAVVLEKIYSQLFFFMSLGFLVMLFVIPNSFLLWRFLSGQPILVFDESGVTDWHLIVTRKVPWNQIRGIHLHEIEAWDDPTRLFIAVFSPIRHDLLLRQLFFRDISVSSLLMDRPPSHYLRMVKALFSGKIKKYGIETRPLKRADLF